MFSTISVFIRKKHVQSAEISTWKHSSFPCESETKQENMSKHRLSCEILYTKNFYNRDSYIRKYTRKYSKEFRITRFLPSIPYKKNWRFHKSIRFTLKNTRHKIKLSCMQHSTHANVYKKENMPVWQRILWISKYSIMVTLYKIMEEMTKDT